MMTAVGFVLGFFAGEVIGILAAAVLIISSENRNNVNSNQKE